MIEITPWHWAGFIVCILFFIAVDLGAFSGASSRRARTVGVRQALGWTGLWMALALLFAAGLLHWRGENDAVQFVTGYLIELSLSLDNLLVIALIFSAFRLSPALQHHALACGILGALVMRGLMIGLGAALIHRFAWILYIFGFFLVCAGVKMACARHTAANLENGLLARLVRRFFPVAADFDGLRLLTRINGRRALTPLALVVLMVESTDLLFAFDSVPAVFSVTRDAFIVFTSNIFAILGLRSLYFVLAGALKYFRYLKFGLSVVLVFVGVKMLVEPQSHPPLWFQLEISNATSLITIAVIVAMTVALSVAATLRERRAAR